MNPSKCITLCAIAGIVIAVGHRAANAQAANCNNQMNMAHALGALKDARASLDKAEHDKGGWRTKAIAATDEALRETEIGCTYKDIHGTEGP